MSDETNITDSTGETPSTSDDDKKNPSQNDNIRIFLESLTRNELLELLDARRKKLGQAAYDTAVTTTGLYEEVLATQINDHSIEAERAYETIGALKDKTHFSQKFVVDGKTILGTPVPQKKSGGGATVTGVDAKAAFAIRSGRMKRIPLYNSGFSIDIAQPNLSMLNAFFNRAHDDTNGYGRQFGAYFFYFNALLIKEAIIELISPLILNSTLKDWNRGTTLMRAIKLVDLKLILNSLSALMFPEGYPFTHICLNPNGSCQHQEETIIDINKLAIHDFKKLDNRCIKHIATQGEVTQKSLSEYQANLGFDGREIRFGPWGFTLKVPSLIDYMEYGKIFNGELISNTFVNNPSEIQRAILFSYYRVYTPFVLKMTLYEKDESVDIVTTDREAIADTLANLQENDTNNDLAKAFDMFISDTEISHICYPATPCPSCGYVPGSGYYTVDPERAFFILSLVKLIRN